ncbi:DGQHR domain-containing protein [Kiloniella sp. b19]|uniref:DGQHR domain-containing protein n=1 Tax=Kiloniella sp. GXU_MW_B19 TaxID=3141326 RepID=UPI0031DB947C
MAFIDPVQVEQLFTKLTTDKSSLGKIYKARKGQYYQKNVHHNLVDEMLKEGWEDYTSPLKTKTKLRKEKGHDTKFEDDIWCQLYELGYRCLNTDNTFRLPYGKGENEKKQIDVIAINEDSILLVECKSAQKVIRAPSYKTEFEGLENRLLGFKKTLEQMFGKDKKIKYIFATRNIKLNSTSTDIERLLSTNSFHYNDNTYDYINSVIKSYKESAHYQFSAMLFKGQSINKNKIEVPAIQGIMGGKKYYMFSIEPHTLLKIGFILHRTSANESEMPTYQRLLIPSRLSGIRKFIDKGGYFPNSVILNFSKNKNKLQFEASSKEKSSISRNGTLKIPNTYAIAYIIDGQHRVYGYAGSTYKDTNTIPVVAFEGLESTDQLEMFMNINQNQKAVSATLRITLEEDLYWGSEIAASRIKALRSSVIQRLANNQGTLFKKISIGEDRAPLSANPFSKALTKTTLLPKANGNKYNEDLLKYSMYNAYNNDHNTEMSQTRDKLVRFLVLCYDYVENYFPEIFGDEHQGFILSNRGTFAYISLISSLNEFETDKGNLRTSTSSKDRFEIISEYLQAALEGLQNLPKEEEEELKSKLGSGADVAWFRKFQLLVHEKYRDYHPSDLIDWQERQDKDLQDKARNLSTEIERLLKNTILSQLKTLYNDDWELEIAPIKRECEKRASEEEERRYREKLDKKEIKWTEQFFITDYKNIIEKHWSKSPKDFLPGFKTFETTFSINIGEGFNSKNDKTKWLTIFNSHRNSLAHEGTKEKGLNIKEVDFLDKIHQELTSRINQNTPNNKKLALTE